MKTTNATALRARTVLKGGWYLKNPNWPEANQLAIYKHGRGFQHGTTVNKSSKSSERDLACAQTSRLPLLPIFFWGSGDVCTQAKQDFNLGPLICKSSSLTNRPRCLLILNFLTDLLHSIGCRQIKKSYYVNIYLHHSVVSYVFFLS